MPLGLLLGHTESIKGVLLFCFFSDLLPPSPVQLEGNRIRVNPNSVAEESPRGLCLRTVESEMAETHQQYRSLKPASLCSARALTFACMLGGLLVKPSRSVAPLLNEEPMFERPRVCAVSFLSVWGGFLVIFLNVCWFPCRTLAPSCWSTSVAT